MARGNIFYSVIRQMEVQFIPKIPIIYVRNILLKPM